MYHVNSPNYKMIINTIPIKYTEQIDNTKSKT